MLPSLFFLFYSLFVSPVFGQGETYSRNFGLSIYPSDPCWTRIRNFVGTEGGRRRVLEALQATQGDPLRILSFIEGYGQKLHISEGGRTVGRPAHFADTHQRIFHYAGVIGPQLLQLRTELPPQGTAPTEEQRAALTQMGEQLKSAILAAITDAPKLYAFGIATYQGRRYFYVDVENIFGGQDPVSLSGLLRNHGTGRLLNAPFTQVLTLSLSEHFIKAFEKQICSPAPDVFVDEKGLVRWADPFSWQEHLWKNTSAPNPDRGKNGKSFTYFMDFFAQNHPQLAREFLLTFLRELKFNDRMTSFEKHLLLEDLFLAQHHRDASMEQKLRLYMQRIDFVLGENSEPLSAVLRAYDAVR